MSKKITMSTKPKKNTMKEFSADDWVSQGSKGNSSISDSIVAEQKEQTAEPTARFTIDIPVSLHARIKSQCALKRVKMREEVLSMLEEKFPSV